MDKNDAQAIGYADDIFMDDSVVLSKTKIQDENILVFMKNWYAQRNGQ